MFSTFLLGTFAVSALAMILLLIAPRRQEEIEAHHLPYMAIGLAVLFAVLAFIGGVAVGS